MKELDYKKIINDLIEKHQIYISSATDSIKESEKKNEKYHTDHHKKYLAECCILLTLLIKEKSTIGG